MGNSQPSRVFVVVDVWRGTATDAFCYSSLAAARRCYRSVIKGLNLEEDDVQVFETELRESKVSRKGRIVSQRKRIS